MKDTLNMILDGGWEISFRIHSADDPIVPSLKFDVKLLGNPPILFSQYLLVLLWAQAFGLTIRMVNNGNQSKENSAC